MKYLAIVRDNSESPWEMKVISSTELLTKQTQGSVPLEGLVDLTEFTRRMSLIMSMINRTYRVLSVLEQFSKGNSVVFKVLDKAGQKVIDLLLIK